MRVYLTSKDIPELGQLPRAARSRILERCAPMTFRHWQTWAALFVCVACAVVGWYLGLIFGGGFWVAPWIGAVLGAAVGGAVLGQVKGTLIRRYIRAELQLQSVHITENSPSNK